MCGVFMFCLKCQFMQLNWAGMPVCEECVESAVSMAILVLKIRGEINSNLMTDW